MNAFPDRHCEVPGCKSGSAVFVAMERQLCADHLLEFEDWEQLYKRRQLHVGQWLITKGKGG